MGSPVESRERANIPGEGSPRKAPAMSHTLGSYTGAWPQCFGEVPLQRFDVDRYHSPDLDAKGSMYVREAAARKGVGVTRGEGEPAALCSFFF